MSREAFEIAMKDKDYGFSNFRMTNGKYNWPVTEECYQVWQACEQHYQQRIENLTEALNAWSEKTEWVQKTARPKELGLHRADVINQRIAELEAKLHKERHDAKTCPVCGVETATVEWIRERKELENKLANMAALVAKKDEAMQSLINHVDAQKAMSEHKTVSGLREALALTAEDVELVEVNHVDYVDVTASHYDVVSTLDDGDKLYKIQMKGK